MMGQSAARVAQRLNAEPVRIAEANPRGVIVVADEYGAASAVGASPERFRLPFPVGDELRPR